MNMYADDTAIYLGSQTVVTLNIYLKQDLERLAEWLEDNNLVLNVAKTKSLLFTSQRHKSNSSGKENFLRDYLQISRCRF